MGSKNQRKLPKKKRRKKKITGKAKYSIPAIPMLKHAIKVKHLPMDLGESLFFLSIKLMDGYKTYFLAREYSKEEAIEASIYSLRNFAYFLKYGLGISIRSNEYHLAMGFVLQ